MCGIVAAVAPEGRRVNTEALARALDALAHRGPDGRGVWTSPDGRVALGHTRLSIIAPESGAQPLLSEDGDVVAAVNGEFYGFEAQRDALRARGHRFRTESDSEVAVHLAEERGLDALEALRGEFGLVWWEQTRGRLVAARDRFGIKPLCWAWIDGALWVASEAKALWAAGLRPGWDVGALKHALHLQYPLPGATLFDGVEAVRPGCALVWDLHRHSAPREVRYWALDVAPETGVDRARSAQGWAEVVGAKLDEAVRLRLRADVPVCVQLSGGVDSSAVLALAAQARPSAPPPAFCVRFTQLDAYDEHPYAQRVAEATGADLHVIEATPEALVDAMPDAVACAEGLAINGHLPAKYLMHRAVRRQGFKVILTGEGADELLAGYPHLRTDLFRLGGRPDQLRALERDNAHLRGIMLTAGDTLDVGAAVRALGRAPAWLEAKASLGWKLRALMRDDVQRDTAYDPVADLLGAFDVSGQLVGRHPVRQALVMWTRTALATYILRTLGDPTEMAHGVEGRVPFLDHALFEALRAAPVEALIRDGVEKAPLRDALVGCLPESIRTRPKRPFIAPPLGLLDDPRAAQALHDTLRGDAFAAHPLVSKARVVALLDRLHRDPAQRLPYDPVLMTLWSVALLQARYRLH